LGYERKALEFHPPEIQSPWFFPFTNVASLIKLFKPLVQRQFYCWLPSKRGTSSLDCYLRLRLVKPDMHINFSSWGANIAAVSVQDSGGNIRELKLYINLIM
jgi:hypothetical protein